VPGQCGQQPGYRAGISASHSAPNPRAALLAHLAGDMTAALAALNPIDLDAEHA
jgi:hypothetical protein